jgi:hypothetical protein
MMIEPNGQVMNDSPMTMDNEFVAATVEILPQQDATNLHIPDTHLVSNLVKT